MVYSFLIAKLNMDSVSSCATVRDLQLLLRDLEARRNDNETIKSELDVVYASILQQINKQNKRAQKYAYRTVSWLQGTARTLTVEELCAVVSLNPDHPEDWKHHDLVSLEQILDCCKGLVVIDEDTKEIRMLHYSAPNYLDRHKVLSRLDVDLSYRAHIFLAVFGTPDIQQSIFSAFDEFSGRYTPNMLPFTSYAATHLAHHVLSSDQKRTSAAVLRFLSDPKCISAYCCSCLMLHRDTYLDEESAFGTLPPDSPLHLAAYFGHDLVIDPLVTSSPPLDINNSDLELFTESTWSKISISATPLVWAVKRGHKDFVQKLLLHPGLDVNNEAHVHILSKISEYWGTSTALGTAITKGDEGILRLLMNHADIDVNQVFGGYWKEQSPLSTAIEAPRKTHEAIIRLLLEKGAVLSEYEVERYGPVQFHGMMHNQLVVLDHLFGPSRDLREAAWLTSMFNIISQSHRLIKTSADFYIPSLSRHVPALPRALIREDINDLNASGYSLLSCALDVDPPSAEIVEWLLDRTDFDVNIASDTGMTPLGVAISRFRR